MVKESTYQCERHKRRQFNPCIGKVPWLRKWQPTRVSLPGKSRGQRNLQDYSSWGCEESDMSMKTHTEDERGYRQTVFRCSVVRTLARKAEAAVQLLSSWRRSGLEIGGKEAMSELKPDNELELAG